MNGEDKAFLEPNSREIGGDVEDALLIGRALEHERVEVDVEEGGDLHAEHLDTVL